MTVQEVLQCEKSNFNHELSWTKCKDIANGVNVMLIIHSQACILTLSSAWPNIKNRDKLDSGEA